MQKLPKLESLESTFPFIHALGGRSDADVLNSLPPVIKSVSGFSLDKWPAVTTGL